LGNFVDAFVDPSTMSATNGGTHFGYLAAILQRNGGGHGYMVGTRISIADIQVYNLVELVLREQFGCVGDFRRHQPLLVAYAARIAAEPRIATYISKRPDMCINGSCKG